MASSGSRFFNKRADGQTMDEIRVKAPGIDGMSRGSMCALVRRNADDAGVHYSVLTLQTSSDTARAQLFFRGPNVALWCHVPASAEDRISEASITASNLGEWYYVLATKQGGTSVPRFHIHRYSTGTWQHGNGDTALPDWDTFGGQAEVTNLWEGEEGFDGRIAGWAVWNNVSTTPFPSDNDIENSGVVDGITAWFDLAPHFLAVFTQDSVSDDVLDQIDGGGQHFRQGTSASTLAPSGFDFQHELEAFEPAGGIILGGQAEIIDARILVELTGSGGLLLGGDGQPAFTSDTIHVQEPAGGIVYGGEAQHSFTRHLLADVAGDGGLALGGEAGLELANPVGSVRVDIAPGADPNDPETWDWVNITTWDDISRVRQDDAIRIVFGKRNEGGRVDPATLQLTLDNRDGVFSSRNPLGPWYGMLHRNTPIRVISLAFGAIPVRFIGHVSEWPIDWNPGGKQDSFVRVNANGPLRRLQQGAKALQSPLRRSVAAHPDVVAYWPCEDGSDSAIASSPLSGVGSMRPSGDFTFGQSVDGLPGAASVMRIDEGARFVLGGVPNHTPSDFYVVQLAWRMDETPTDERAVMDVYSTSLGLARWKLRVSDTEFQVTAFDDDESTVFQETQTLDDATIGQWLRAVLVLEQDGSDVNWSARLHAIDVDATALQSLSGVESSVNMGRITQAGVNGTVMFQERFAGQIGVFTADSDISADLHDPFHGHTGETDADRVERLCDEQGIDVTVRGDGTITMGPQQIDTLVVNLRHCEDTGHGFLHEDGAGLGYVTLDERYNQTVHMNVSADALARTPKPTDDDSILVNDQTIERIGGSSARVTDPASIGTDGLYERAEQVNTEGDTILRHMASFRVLRSLVDDYRWPLIPIELHRPDAESLIPDWTSMQLCDRVTVEHNFDQIPGVTIDVQVEGWTERLSRFTWDVGLYTVPNRPYAVGTIESDRRIDTSAAALDENINDSATEFDVASTGEQPWVNSNDHAGEFPFDIEIGGERMTVTAISGDTSPQTFTVTRGVNGITKAHSDGDAVRVAEPLRVALT